MQNPTRRAFNTIEESPQQEQRSNNNHNHRQQHNYRKEERKSASNTKQEGHRERSGSTSTLKSLGKLFPVNELIQLNLFSQLLSAR